jgi:hypothetical protein
MASLKAFLPEIAKVVGTTADALYSRQRALSGLGVLETVEGRGPGSGVALSSEAVAALIIALMTADSLHDTDERVRRACKAEAEDEGVKSLQLTLASFLSSADSVKKLQGLSIHREESATIMYDSRARTEFANLARTESANFRIHKGRGARSPAIRITATMAGKPIQEISKALRAALGDTKT